MDWTTNNAWILYTFPVDLFYHNWGLRRRKNGVIMRFFVVGHNTSLADHQIFRDINDSVGRTCMMNECSLGSITKMRKVWETVISCHWLVPETTYCNERPLNQCEQEQYGHMGKAPRNWANSSPKTGPQSARLSLQKEWKMSDALQKIDGSSYCMKRNGGGHFWWCSMMKVETNSRLESRV